MTTSIFGSVVHRTEDPRFLAGQGRYVDNIPVEGALRASFVRSMMAHARISGIDASVAAAMPGVVAVLAAADLNLRPQPPSGSVEGAFDRPVLADEVVRFVGEPLAVVLADTQAQAMDAAEVVGVEYEPLVPVIGPEAALDENAPLLFPEVGTNLAEAFASDWDEDVLEGAEVVVRGRVVNQRLAPVPMETNALLAVPEEGGGLTVWVSTQVPFDVRNDLADWLGLDKGRVRAIAPDVGGGFGAKLTIYPEYLVCAAAALRVGRPVRWMETRSESMLSMTHGRAQVNRFELGATRDGIIVGLRVDIVADAGAYPIATFLPATTQLMLSGVYRIPRIACRGRSVVTNTTPVAPYRGAGRPEATALLERAVDLLAAELDMDPSDVRRRNLIPPDAFPLETAAGATYDVGDYERALDEALRLSGYEDLRKEQAERRARGDWLQLGIGVSTYVEVTGFAREFGGGAPRRHRHGPDRPVAAGAGPRDLARPDRLGDPWHLLREGAGGPLRHRDRPERRGDVRLALAPDRRLGRVGSERGGAGEGEGRGRGRARGGRSRRRAARGRPDRRGRRARPGAHLGGARRGGGRSSALARGPGVGPRGLGEVQAEGIHVPLRRARRRGRGGSRDRRGPPRPARRGGRLRSDPEPHARGGPGPRWAGPGHRPGPARGGRVRRARHPAHRQPGRIPDARPHGAAGVRHVAHGDPHPAKGIGESDTVGSTAAVQSAVVDALSHLGIRHIDMPLSPERVWRAVRGAASGPAE